MNEEELRAEVTRLTNENKSLTDKYNTLNEQIKTKNEEINSLHTYSEDEKDTNKQSDSIKKDKFKSSNKTTSPKEEC